VLLEFETYRWHGHYEGDAQPYKPEDESASWREADPLLVAAARLVERGEAAQDRLDAIREEARERVERAVETARQAPDPEPEEAFAHVFGD
jgi:TPP-dependent pyruvate/acetoin dehydrogenase alpha subunit